MLIKKYLLSSLLLLLSIISFAQQNQTVTISGDVKEKSGEVIPHASVRLENTRINAVTDQQGKYQLRGVSAGKYNLVISVVGYTTIKKQVDVKGDKDLSFLFKMESTVNELENITVMGRTENQKINKQSYNVISIDAKKLHNSTLDLSHALDRVSGVRVRESGGVGSRADLSLNGFTGNQVKFFLDGVPMDNFGSSFQINNIPVNLAERVEVYKGVVPIWLGGDALGGAINIVTNNSPRTYVDASYSFGSFNTHRSTLNAGYVGKNGFTVQLNAFQNYSDNNYWVNMETADLNTGFYYPEARLRRFHDKYRNETVILNIGVTGKKWADKLLFGFTGGASKSDIQTGARMESVFGERRRRGNTIMPTLKYQKNDLFLKGLNVSVTGNFNFGEEQLIDTANRKYNWLGQFKQYSGPGSESQGRSLNIFKNNNGLATMNVSYKISDRHSILVNNTYNTFDRKEADELYPNSAAYQQPKKSTKNILGVGYKFDLNEKWSTSLFAKQYDLKTNYTRSFNPSNTPGDIQYQHFEDKRSKLGYGVATSYYIKQNLQLKASYEKTYRLPTPEEFFGNVTENFAGNLGLRPESSDNANLGLSYQTSFSKIHALTLDVNLLYRNSVDFIRPELNLNQTMTTLSNQGSVRNAGIDAEIRYSYKQRFTAGVNVTYQNLRNHTMYEPGETQVSAWYKDRIPNIPYFFGNLDASYFFNDVVKKGNNLSLGYNLLFVNTYYLSWPGRGDTQYKNNIPRQFNHEVNATYVLANGKYNIALECKNLLDNRLYDNFSLQKPSRAFYIKVRYFFNKSLQ